MKQMILSTVLMLLATGTAFAAAQNQGLRATRMPVQFNAPMVYEKPAAGYSAQHFTNSLGCTYSRTQAPGYPMVWHLLVNTRVPGCPNTVPGQ